MRKSFGISFGGNMKNKLGIGIIVGVMCSLLAFAVFFTAYVLSDDSNSELWQSKVTGTPTTTPTVTTAVSDAGQSNTADDFTPTPTLAIPTQDEFLEKIDDIKELIDYYSLYGADEQEMLDGIYRGLMSSMGDAYATYYNQYEWQSLLESTSGVYCGIGAYVSQNVYTYVTTIVKPFVNGPAYNAGMLPGDIVTAVNGVDMTTTDLSEIVARMKGDSGTTVTVTVEREGADAPIDLVITRARIEVPTIEYEMLDNNIGYVYIMEFDEVTVQQFIDAIDTLEAQGMTNLIIDLRDNPGGLVSSTVSMLERLISPGLIVYTENKNGYREEEYATKADKVDVPMVILVNGNSASASEIFTGCIKDYGVGTVIGTQTYGKGIVQSLIELGDGTAIKLTTSQYFTPKGNAVHGVGITPDYIVELSEELKQAVVITKAEDNQLQAAIRFLLTGSVEE